MKRVASIQDISCLGRCSQTVALPIISAEGVECTIVPTAVLSTHTVFKNFTRLDLTDQIRPIANHWKEQNLHLDAIYTGYLASAGQIDEVLYFIDLLKDSDTFLFVDPAMADHGKLYTGFDTGFPATMAKLVAHADIAAPNLTEACMMTGTEFREEYDEAYIKDLLKKLTDLGTKTAVLTGVSFDSESVGVMSYNRETKSYFSYFNHREPRAFHGTGDIFASTTVGAMLRGLSLEDSLTLAVDFTLQCIQETIKDSDASWYGVHFEKALPMLIHRLSQ